MGDKPFVKLSLAGLDLRNAIFRRCRFHRALLDFTDLRAARFSHCRFDEVSFERSDLTKAKLSDCKLQACSFKEATLCGITNRNNVVRNIDFSEADLSKARFSGCEVIDCDFSRANLAKLFFDAKGVWYRCKLERTVGFQSPQELVTSRWMYDYRGARCFISVPHNHSFVESRLRGSTFLSSVFDPSPTLTGTGLVVYANLEDIEPKANHDIYDALINWQDMISIRMDICVPAKAIRCSRVELLAKLA